MLRIYIQLCFITLITTEEGTFLSVLIMAMAERGEGQEGGRGACVHSNQSVLTSHIPLQSPKKARRRKKKVELED